MAGRVALAMRTARRAVPVVLEIYRRWDRLSPQEKERYTRRVRESSDRVRELYRKRRGR